MALEISFWNQLLLALAPACVTGLSAFFYHKYHLEKLKSEVNTLRSNESRLKSTLSEFEKSQISSDNVHERAIAYKSKAISSLNDALELARADRATLYVPIQDSGGDFLGLVVLATAPNDLASASFLGTAFSGRDAQAVRCFLNRETVTSSHTNFKFDEYSPSSTYSECLQKENKNERSPAIGVVQFLSSGGNVIDFDKAADAISHKYASLIEAAEFFGQVNQMHLNEVGLNAPVDSKRGAVLTFDLSNSSSMFTDEARIGLTKNFMNELVEETCTLLSKNNGILESFTGDGFLAAFPHNPREPTSSVSERALNCAFELKKRCEILKKDFRKELADTYTELNARIGISTGIIHPISYQFSHVREINIIGRTPSLSKLICDNSSRTKPSISIDEATYLEISASAQKQFEKIARSNLIPKLAARKISVYEEKS